MRTLAALMLSVVLTACASVPPSPGGAVLRAPRPLTPTELAQLTEGKALCVRPNNDGSCVSIATVSVTPSGVRFEDTGLTRIDYFVENFTRYFGADPLITESDRQLFVALERRRAAGNYDLIRATLRYEGVYDPARRAFCTVPRPDALVFSNAEFAFTRARDSDRTGDWGVPQDLRGQIIDLTERMFASPLAMERLDAQELTEIRNSLRHAEPACIVFYGIESEAGVRISSMSTAAPDQMEWASTNRVRVDAHPIEAVLALRIL